MSWWMKCAICNHDQEIGNDLVCLNCKYDNRHPVALECVRTCIDCGDIKVLAYKSRVKDRCQSCAAIERAKTMPPPRPRLPTEQNYTAPRVTVKDARGKSKTLYLRTCTKCESQAYIGFKPKKDSLCQECNRSLGSHRKSTQVKTKANRKKYDASTRKKKTISQEAIDRQRRLLAEHKEAQAKAKPIPVQSISDDDMVNTWLNNNEVKQIGENISIKDVHLITINLGMEAY